MPVKIFQKFFKTSEQQSKSQEPNPQDHIKEQVSAVFADNGFYGFENFSALENSALWACVSKLSRTMATLPLHLFEEENNSKKIVKSGALSLLLKQPNKYMTNYQFKFIMAFNFELHGVAYAVIEKNLGLPVALYPISPNALIPYWNKGVLTWMYSNTGETFKDDDILKISNLPLSATSALCPLNYSLSDISLAKASKDLSTDYFKNGGQISDVMTLPAGATDEMKKQSREEFKRYHSGTGNAHKTLFLIGDTKYEAIQLKNDDLGKLQTAESWTVLEVARRFGVPPFFAGDMTKATYSNSEQQGAELVTYSLQPRAVAWESALQCLAKNNQYFKFNFAGLLRGDNPSRSAFYHNGLMDGWLSVNEVRAYEDLNPIKDGNKHMFPMNYTTLAKVGSNNGYESTKSKEIIVPEETFKEDKNKKDLFYLEEKTKVTKTDRSKLEKLIRKYTKLEVSKLKALAKEGGNISTDFAIFLKELEESVIKDYKPIFNSISTRLIPIAQKEAGVDDIEVSTDALEAYTNTYATGAAGRHVNSKASEVSRKFKDIEPDKYDDLAKTLSDNWIVNNPVAESKGETSRASNAFNLFLYTALGVTVWHVVASSDSCEFCAELDGKVVEINGVVLAKGAKMDDGAGNTRTINKNYKHPPFHNGCNCAVAPGR
jgi:HK97 family phage portal protein